MFATRYLHYLDQQGLSVWAWQAGQLLCLARFAEGDSAYGVPAFADWIGRHRSGIHHVLLDLPSEGYHVEQIPPVSGSDRKALIARRQMQQFFGTPYATSMSLGRSVDGRRDERVLMLALTHPPVLEPWLQCLRDAEARLARISTASLLTRQILAGLQPDSTNGLILSLSASGIRQTYFEQGSLRFSRLSPAPDGPLLSWGEACLHEAQKTAQYLTAQRWTTRNARLPVWLLVRREDFARLAEQISAISKLNSQLDFRLAGLDAIARQVGIRRNFADSDCAPLLIHLALREKGPAQLAPPADRRFFQLWRIRNAIAAAGACLGFGFALTALASFRETQHMVLEDQRLHAEMQADQVRYQQLLASLPEQPINLEALQGIVASHTRLINQPQPSAALLHISRALDEFPDIRLQTLGWQTDSPDTGERKTGAPPSRLFTLDASLPEDLVDARTATARIHAFAATLKRYTAAEIAGLKMPFDSESDKTLRSDLVAQKSRASFQIRLRLAEGPP
jgi:hypothetical protein